MSADYTPKLTNYKYRFDFEVGYLVKSPCKKCLNRIEFPGCSNDCDLLAGIHQVLADTINSTHRD